MRAGVILTELRAEKEHESLSRVNGSYSKKVHVTMAKERVGPVR